MGQAKDRGTFEERKAAATPKTPPEVKVYKQRLSGVHPTTQYLVDASVYNAQKALEELE